MPANARGDAASAAAAAFPHWADAATEEATVRWCRWRPPQVGEASAEALVPWAGAANAPAASGCGSGSPRAGSQELAQRRLWDALSVHPQPSVAARLERRLDGRPGGERLEVRRRWTTYPARVGEAKAPAS